VAELDTVTVIEGLGFTVKLDVDAEEIQDILFED
jgi:hypothetical protein